MRIALVVLAVVALAMPVAAGAENYGGVSRTYKQQIVSLIRAKFGYGWSGDTAIRVAACESGFNPRAANWGDSNGGSFGLFQINKAHRDWVDFGRIYDPAYNISVAYRLSGGGRNWGPWACY